MAARKRFFSLLGAAGLLTSGLVAASVPAADAAISCETLLGAVNSENRIVYRYLENDAVVKEKQSKVLSAPIEALLYASGEQISGGSRSFSTAYKYAAVPRIYKITNLDASDTLSVTGVKTTYTHTFNATLVANSGSYYVYGVSPSTGNLVQWTRYSEGAAKLSYGSPKVVQKGMSGLKTLTWTGTFKLDGVYKDLFVATTKAGALKQIQIPLLKPAYDKQTTLATSGFADVVGISNSFCNDNPRFLSMLAVNGTQARWWTLASQTAPSPSGLVDRGLIAGEHDWNLHAIG